MRYIETIRLQDGVLCHLEYHRQRMLRTAALELPQIEIPAECRQGRYKCRILYDTHVREITFTPYPLPQIHSLRLVEDDTIDYALKYEDRSALQALMALRGDCDDVLIVRHGYLTDTSFCNILLEKQGQWYTPDTPLLAGTQRQYLLDQGRVKVVPIRVEDLPQFDRLLLVNAMIDPEDGVEVPLPQGVRSL
jgi:4-amino-4-deoxychorismate lyase